MVGDELLRRRRRRGSPAMAVRARLVRRLRGTRALGARLARRRGGRRSSWTRRHGARTMESATTATVRLRWRRPWCGRARERGRGRVRCPRGRGSDVELVQASRRREEEAGRRAAAWRALVPPSSTCLPAWRRQAARWSGCWAGPARWAGWWAARLVPSLPFYLSFFIYSVALWTF